MAEPLREPVASSVEVERAWREHWGRLLALLVAQTRRLDLAEDALADAFEKAARTWGRDGVPDNPAGWLVTTARRRIIDLLRAEAVRARASQALAGTEQQSAPSDQDDGTDDLLRLVLLCAHPALSADSASALTLRLVLGVPTSDIARLFLVTEPTMAARLTRAKKRVVAAGLPFRLPSPELLPERLDTVAEVAYLAFTAGYAPGTGEDVTRVELAGEAIRLVRLVRETGAVAQGHVGLRAILALMVLQHARRDARSHRGELVLLPEQDRNLWHCNEIDEGMALVEGLVTENRTAGDAAIEVTSLRTASLLLQALIAREHALTVDGRATNWPAVCALYEQLERVEPSPVVRLNRAVAVAEAQGPEAGLALLADLDAALPHSHRLPAVRGELLARAGRNDEAAEQLALALERCGSLPEQTALRRRLDTVADAHHVADAEKIGEMG